MSGTPEDRLTGSVFGSEVARVEVGPGHEPFTIHVDLLCWRSRFFRKALKGPFKEAQTNVVPMPDDDVEAFSRFELWLYSNHILADNGSKSSVSMITLMKLWVLAEKLMLPTLQNEVMDIIILDFIPKLHEFPPALSEYLYSNTSSESHLRSMIVDFVAQSMSSDHFQKYKEEWNAELLQDVCSALMNQTRELGNSRPPIGTYYVARNANWKKCVDARYVEDRNAGTIGQMFVLLVETDGTPPCTTNILESITASLPYSGKFSFEELRLADYMRHPKKFGRL